MNRRLLIIFIVAVFLAGGLAGSLMPVKISRAGVFGSLDVNLFKDFYNQIKKFFQPKLNNQPAQSDGRSGEQQTSRQSIIDQLQLFTGSTESNSQSSTPIYSPTVDYETAVIKAVEDSSPAVISITISKDLPVIEQCPYNPFGDLPPEFQQFFGQGFEFSQPCQKGTKRQETGGGSGFIISSDGLVVTNKHVVLDESASYTVLTNDGKKYGAQVLARDPNSDLAVLKIPADNLPVVRLGNSDSVKLGQTAIAIGNALGEFRNTVSVGVVSGLSRNITAGGGGFSERIEGLIQTDAAINSGNSGGPLLNLRGEVIGINVAMVSGAQNIGFSIPINQVKKSIESVRNVGRIVSSYLGVRYMVINSELAKKEKLPVENGALVRGNSGGPAVIPNSPAAKAGIQAEDVIVEINGEKITSDKPLNSLLQKYGVGETINLKILRGGKEIEVGVKLEERPINI